LWTRSILLLELYSYDQVIQNNGSTISSFLFKSSSEFLICCTFKNSSSSSFCYTLACHACNLSSYTTFLLSFDSFQVTIQHVTITRMIIAGIALKTPPDFFTFMWYSSSTWVITRLSLSCRIWMAQVPKTFPTCEIKNFKDICNAWLIQRWSNWTCVKVISTIIFTVEGQRKKHNIVIKLWSQWLKHTHILFFSD